MSRPAGDPMERFASKYEEVGECWEWTGGISKAARVPIFCYKHKGVTARQFIMKAMGYDVEGKYVAPKCGSWNCVRPEHMEILDGKKHLSKMAGTRFNDTTRRAKIANTRRTKEGLSKLNMEKAREIRVSDMNCREAAEVYGVSKALIAKIRRGECWREFNNMFSGLMR